MIIEAILTILYTALFVFIIHKLNFFKIEGVSPKILSFVFILKVLSGTALLLIYTYFYTDRPTADLHKYFEDGNVMYSAIKNNPLDYLRMLLSIDAGSEHLKEYYKDIDFWYKTFNYDLYNDNRTIIRVNAFFRLFSFGYLNVHNVFMSFLSFIGMMGIYKVFVKYYSKKKYLLIIAIFLFPSVILWSSGALKEGIVMFSFGIGFWSFYNIINMNFKIFHFIGLSIGIFLLLISKFYVLIAALPGLIFLVWYYISKNKKHIVLKFTVIHVLFILLAFYSKYISKYDFPDIMSRKQYDFICMVEATGDVGSFIEIPLLKPTVKSLALNSPVAFFRTFARPHIFEIHNMMSLPAALENLIIILLLILSIVFFNKNDLNINLGLLLFCLSFTIILFTLCGLTTPVLGALVRYKIPALPFLIIIFTVLIDFDKLKSIFKKKING